MNLSCCILLFTVVNNNILYPLINVGFEAKIRNVKEHAKTLMRNSPEKYTIIKNASVLIIDEISSMSQDLFSFIWYLVKYIKAPQSEDISENYWNSSIKNFLMILVGDVLQNLPIPLKQNDIDWLRNYRSHYYNANGDRPFFTSNCFYNNFDIGMLFTSHHRGQVESMFVSLCLKARTNRMDQDDINRFMELIGGAVFEPSDPLAPGAPGPVMVEGKGDNNLRLLIATANQMAREESLADKNNETFMFQQKFLFKDRLDICTLFARSPESQPVVPSKLKILTGERNIISKYAKFPQEAEVTVDSSDNKTIRYAYDDFVYASGNECTQISAAIKEKLKR